MEIDYEKEYTEALERAKRLRDSKYQTMNAKRVAEEIFPQLAESEDERIRKFLIQHVSEWIGCIEHDLKISSKDIESEEELAMFKAGLAYLEKQKEQKPAGCADDVVEEAEEYTSKVSCGEYGVEVTEAYIAGVLSERNRGTEWSEFDKGVLEDAICATDTLGNDESFNKSNPNLAKAFRVAKDWLKSLPERINLQPKQEWSEEEKDKLNKIERLIVNANAHCNSLIGDKEAIDLQHFIRSIIKPTTNPAEWSEEDERMRNQLIYDIEYHKKEGLVSAKQNKATEALYNGIEKCYDEKIAWLKSLRPQPKQEWDAHDKAIVNCIVCCLDGQFVSESARKQCLVWFNKHRRDFLNSPHWKPSGEQMEYLSTTEALLRECGYNTMANRIALLCEELNKLI